MQSVRMQFAVISIFVVIFQIGLLSLLFAGGNSTMEITNLQQREGYARHIQGHATGSINVQIVDPSLIKENHTYRFTFQDSTLEQGNRQTKNFTLQDTTLHVNVIADAPLVDSLMSPISYTVDGFQFSFDNPEIYAVNEDSSGWNDPAIHNFVLAPFRYSGTVGYAEAADYQIEFGSVGVDTSIKLHVSPTRALHSAPVNFRVKNVTTDQYIHFGFWERDIIPGEEGMFTGFTERTRTDEIIFVDDSLKTTWQFKLDINELGDSTKHNPKAGDIATLFLQKPFSSEDIFDMTVPDDFATTIHNAETTLPRQFALKQNYPNPFNAQTTITFYMPVRLDVKIAVFDVQGRRVRLLAQQNFDAGSHRLVWDGRDDAGKVISSGFYFINMSMDGMVLTKKATLLK